MYAFKHNQGLKVRLKICGSPVVQTIQTCSIFFFVYFINIRYYMGNLVGFYIVLFSRSHFINIVKFIDYVLIMVCANHFYYFKKRQYSRRPGTLMFILISGRCWWCSFSFYDKLWIWQVEDATITTDEWSCFICLIYRFNILQNEVSLRQIMTILTLLLNKIVSLIPWSFL